VEDHIQSEYDAPPSSRDKYGNPVEAYDDLFWGMVRRGLAEYDKRREEARQIAEAAQQENAA
jgi:hypothetical protein